MFSVIIRGFAEDLSRCGPGFEPLQRDLNSEEEVINLLKQVEAAELPDVSFEGVALIQGKGCHLEIRKETGGLILNDRNDLNLQNLKIKPEEVFGGKAEETPEEEEAEPVPVIVKEKGSQGKGWVPLVGIAVVVTVLIQGLMLLQPANPFPAATVRFVQDESKVNALKQAHTGLYRNTEDGLPLGILLNPDGTFALLDDGGAGQPITGDSSLFPYEQGQYRFGYDGEILVVELAGKDLVDVSGSGALNFYGYEMTRDEKEGGSGE